MNIIKIDFFTFKNLWKRNEELFIRVGVFYLVLVSVSCPKALYHSESDNLFRITVVVADWLG